MFSDVIEVHSSTVVENNREPRCTLFLKLSGITVRRILNRFINLENNFKMSRDQPTSGFQSNVVLKVLEGAFPPFPLNLRGIVMFSRLDSRR